MKKSKHSDKPFKVDNVVLQNVAAQTAPLQLQKKRAEEYQQLSMPGFDILTPLEECVIYACYYFAEREGKYDQKIQVSLTEFAERLAYERRESGQYSTFGSDVYRDIFDALCRLHTATWLFVLSYKGSIYPLNTRFLTTLGYGYSDLLGPDGLDPQTAPQHILPMLKNVNPYSDHPAAAVWAIEGRRATSIIFQLSSDLIQGILGRGQHIGYSLMPPSVFDIRHKPGGNRITTRLLTWVIRQASNTPKISLKNLRRQLVIAGRNVSRDRDSIVKGLQFLKDDKVIEDFSIDSRDMVTIYKATPAEKQLPETTG